MNFWRALRTLHIHLSLASLLLLLFFGVTGVLLVHASRWGLDLATSRTVHATVPPAVLAADRLAIVEHLRAHGAVGAVTDYAADAREVRVTFERPSQRGDALIALPSGELELTLESRGPWALLLDLHTGKAAGDWWLAIDLAGVLWTLVGITGLMLWLQLKKRRRVGIVWLVVGALAGGLGYWGLTP